MRNAKGLVCLALVLVAMEAAAQVNEVELRSVGDREIVFENYTGPHTVFDTADEIVGIGRALDASLRVNGRRGDFFGLYSVIRAVDPTDTTRLNADIIVLEPRAGVDHIRNVRRIIAGYLQSAYDYTLAQAETLAVFATVYNAVYRGNIAELGRKYTPAVMSNLDATNAGIALRYSEWPGKTRLIIPVGKPLAAPVLGTGAPPAVSTSELSVPQVVEQMRTEPGQGLEERKQMVEVRETEVEQARQQIQEARTQLEEQRAAEVAQNPAQTQAAPPAAAQPSQPVTAAPAVASPAATTPAEAQTPQPAATPAAQAEQRIAEAEAQVAERQREIQAERESIVADERTRPETTPTATTQAVALSESLLFLASRGQSRGGTLVVIDPTSRKVTSTLDGVLSADFVFFQDSVVVVQRDGNEARLVLLDPKTLAVTARTQDAMEEATYVHAQAGAIYAVTRQNEGPRLGRYDPRLERTALSTETVAPSSYIRVFGEEVYVGEPGGDILVLSAADLSTRARVTRAVP